MEFKNYKSVINDIDEAKGYVDIYVSAYGNKDLVGDIMDHKAFNKTVSDFNSGGSTQLRHLYNHTEDLLLGLPVEMSSDQKGLRVISHMNMNKSFVRDIFSDYKFFADHNNSLKHSIGYTAINKEFDKKSNTRILKEVKLFEYSTIPFMAANPETPTNEIKSLDNQSKISLMEEVKQMIEKGNYSDERFEQLELKYKHLESLIAKYEPSKDTQKEDKPIQTINKIDIITHLI